MGAGWLNRPDGPELHGRTRFTIRSGNALGARCHVGSPPESPLGVSVLWQVASRLRRRQRGHKGSSRESRR